MAIIESGGVASNKAIVDIDGRLYVQSHTETTGVAHARLGHAYNINTGDINVSNATKLTLLYLKNTGTKDIVIEAFIYLTGNSTSGTATTDFLYTAMVNPTAGDIITNANDVATNTNRRIGDSNLLTALAYKGAVGETAVSGGTDLFGTRLASSGRQAIPFTAVLPKAQSVAVDFTAKTSNSACLVQVAISCYEQNLS